MADFFPPQSRETFAALYPETAGKLTHSLPGHPMLELDALVALSERMRPIDVERNLADIPIGIDPADLADNGLSAAETLRSIAANGSWMVLKFVEQDAGYRALLHDILGELEPIVAAATGPMIKLEAFIFVSSPNAVTPFHFDPEHNILLQVRGSKVMTVFAPGDPAFAADEVHEVYHAGGRPELPWRDEMEPHGIPFELGPGDAVYVPVMAPHFVRNGPEVSVSISVTWRSRWSYAEADARAFNGVLRRAGFKPAAPARWPRQNLVKAYGWRTLRKLRRLAG
jgi:hypothetical protein